MCLRNLCVCIWVYVPPHEALTNDKMLKCERERERKKELVYLRVKVTDRKWELFKLRKLLFSRNKKIFSFFVVTLFTDLFICCFLFGA